MIKITFVCHGNICRSPMAEYLFKDLIKEKGVAEKYSVRSAATSDEELGNPVYPPVKKILGRMGIDCESKRAEKLVVSDYEGSDYIIVMDERNVRNALKIFGGDSQGKIKKLMSFAGEDTDVFDPYWTRDFERTFCDVTRGVNGLLDFLERKK